MSIKDLNISRLFDEHFSSFTEISSQDLSEPLVSFIAEVGDINSNIYKKLKSRSFESQANVEICLRKLQETEAAEIRCQAKAKENKVKDIAQKLKNSLDSVNEKNEKLLKTLDALGPGKKSNPISIDFSHLISQNIKYSEDCVELSEKQSVDRKYHEFTVRNTTDFVLNTLKIFIKGKKKILENFKLGPQEKKTILLVHEYDLLMDEGVLGIQVISCSFPVSNNVVVPLIDVSLEGDAIKIENRFVAQKIRDIKIGNYTHKIQKINHFETLEIPMRPEFSNMVVSVFNEKGKKISNDLKIN